MEVVLVVPYSALMITDALRRRIRRVLARYPFVEAAYLFGSHAAGRARPDSDVDLAVVGSMAELHAHKLDILADLTAEGVDGVDLVALDCADAVMRFEAVHLNCLVFARPDFDHGGYFSRTLREYFDLEPYLRVQREAFKRRVLDGQA
ncbi:MAG: nucleotidyltransferase domain-containing protein [Gammaproteobacteria bacterium]|nr:nucleotidyltransferase domain-containing protein [Gammaproteobacteria bacterium]